LSPASSQSQSIVLGGLPARGLARDRRLGHPRAAQEVGWFIPGPAAGTAAPQTNDVEVDARGLVYIVDRYAGFDILEFAR